MVAVCVCDHRSPNRPPRVDVEIAGGAIESAVGVFQQSRHECLILWFAISWQNLNSRHHAITGRLVSEVQTPYTEDCRNSSRFSAFHAVLAAHRRSNRGRHCLSARTAGHAAAADVARGDAGPRLGRGRRRVRHRRRLRRSSELRRWRCWAGCWRAKAFAWRSSASPTGESCDAWRTFGRPRLFFAISAGNMDSMINHYTANRKVRNDDAYSPRRADRPAARPRNAGLLPARPRSVQGRAGHRRRRRSQPAAARSLRLLERQGPPLDHPRLQGRPARLRHGRAADRRDRPAAERAAQTVRDLRDMRGVVYRLGARSRCRRSPTASQGDGDTAISRSDTSVS